MKVKYRRFEFETDEMAAYPTGVATMSMIYVTTAGLAFLKVTRSGWEEPRIRHLPRTELIRFANLYNITELQKRFCRRDEYASPKELSTVG